MQQFGLIGRTLGHSFSHRFFEEKFRREGIEATYENYELAAVTEFPQLLVAKPDLRGLNVTIPYKESIIPYLDTLSEEAEEIGAVNTIRLSQRNGKPYLEGFNTDIIGFSESLKPLMQQQQAALVLGTGGASKAVVLALKNLGVEVQVVSRSAGERRLTYVDLTPEVMASHQLIVNCSPVGMFPNINEAPQLPYDCLTPQHLLYDLVYNPAETLFLRFGHRYGAQIKSGLEMLHLQAEAAWEIWTT